MVVENRSLVELVDVLTLLDLGLRRLIFALVKIVTFWERFEHEYDEGCPLVKVLEHGAHQSIKQTGHVIASKNPINNHQ